jgi:hypothetical protein
LYNVVPQKHVLLHWSLALRKLDQKSDKKVLIVATIFFKHWHLTPLEKLKNNITIFFLYNLVPQKTCYNALDPCVKHARPKE